MMKFLCLAMLFCLNLSVAAQIKATTEKGRKVILYEDGTWNYNDSASAYTLDSSFKVYTKPATSRKALYSSKIDFGFYYNETSWAATDIKLSDVQEFMLKLKNQDAYCIVVTEQIMIPLENFSNIIRQSIKLRGGIIDVKKEEYRMVNGVKTLFLEFDATTQGMEFTYAAYYASDESGSIQMTCYTTRNLYKKHEATIQQLLNGLVAKKNNP